MAASSALLLVTVVLLGAWLKQRETQRQPLENWFSESDLEQ